MKNISNTINEYRNVLVIYGMVSYYRENKLFYNEYLTKMPST